MTDRLKNLRQNALHTTEAPTPLPPPTNNDPFAAFWDQYHAVERKIQDINNIMTDISRIDDSMQKSQDPDELGNKRTEMHGKLEQIGNIANGVRTDLEQMQKQVNDLNSIFPGSAQVRLQRNHFHVLSNNFAAVVNKYTTIQDGIKERFVRQVTRQYSLAGISLDEDKVQRIIAENPNALQENIFYLQGNKAQTAEVVSVYNTIAQRHEDILSIERSLHDLMELFVQFSIIIQDQGRMVDNIEQNIAQAKEYVEDGVAALETAKEHQKSNRSCLWWIVMLAVLVLIAILVIKFLE